MWNEEDECDDGRGLHIAIINPYDGSIEHAESYDTYESSDRLDAFLDLY